MDKEKFKRPNATKHSAFAATTILPGENPEEFQELHSKLIEEWMPEGASEEDAVLSIAKAVWRKRRAQKFLLAQMLRNLVDPNHPSYDDTLGLLGLIHHITQRPETGFDDSANLVLPARAVDYLKQKCPRSKFNSTEEWVHAINVEVLGLMFRYAGNTEQPAMDLGYLGLSAATVTDEAFRQEVALEERLDAMIDRAVKRLIQIKAMKQMLAQTGAMRAGDQQTKMVARKTANGF